MSDQSSMSLPQAARRLGVSVRAVRQAVRGGRVPALPSLGALAAVPANWVAQVQAGPGGALRDSSRPKVPAFARYEGTSAWHKYKRRVKEYKHHCAAVAAKG